MFLWFKRTDVTSELIWRERTSLCLDIGCDSAHCRIAVNNGKVNVNKRQLSTRRLSGRQGDIGTLEKVMELFSTDFLLKYISLLSPYFGRLVPIEEMLEMHSEGKPELSQSDRNEKLEIPFSGKYYSQKNE